MEYVTASPEKPVGRLRRAAWLVVLSWALAGSFYLLDGLALLFMGAAEDSAWFGRLQTLNQDLAPRPSVRPASVSTEAWAQSRLAAFALGRAFGLASAVADSQGDPGLAAQAAALMARPAAELGVPAPPLFRPEHKARFLIEFDAHLEADPAGTVRALGEGYSPGHGELFRLGAVLELQEFYANGLGRWAPVSRAEVRKYGHRSGLSEDLWGPFTRDPAQPVPPVQRASARERALQAIQQQIAAEATRG